ncbi:M4 family metallopeptidase [Phytomonospora sp. NPDC050363]|uniref:M4 family metallopeptidase n=1 Tax=Phytomonospora sp. NPDC050363 TaxID=3155642 RepID=UPI0033ED7DF5
MRRLIGAGAATVLATALLTAGAMSYADEPGDPAAGDVLGIAAAAADGLVAQRGEDLKLAADDTVARTGVSRALGLNFVSYTRGHAGLPVVGGDFVVVTDDTGNVLYTQVAQGEPIDVTTTPKVTADSAEKTVAALLDDPQGSPELVVLAWANPALAWESVVEGTEDGAPSVTHVFVDALTGEEITRYDEVAAGTGRTFYNGQGGDVTVGTSADGSGYAMTDPARSGVSCAEDGGSPLTDDDDVWGDGTGTDLVTACVDAMYAAGVEWDMLADWLDRDGFTGDGQGFPMYVGMDAVNAYWDGGSTTFGHSQDGQRQLTPMDIVAHELGHGIFQHTPGGSGGGNETGGINEGTGDIFGALTEWYAAQANDEAHDPGDYTVGEEGGLLNPGEPIRYMFDPAQAGDPNCWTEEIPGTEVHAAAGPIDHWFYLLAEGTAAGGDGKPGSTTCDGSTLTGIGVEKAGQVWMGALNGKTSGWTYTEARTAALNFAATSALFPTCAEYDATKAAFDAVTVPAEADPACSK